MMISAGDLKELVCAPASENIKTVIARRISLTNGIRPLFSLGRPSDFPSNKRMANTSKTDCMANAQKAYRQLLQVENAPPIIGPQNEDNIQIVDMQATTLGTKWFGKNRS
jgi:hypothetical protein